MTELIFENDYAWDALQILFWGLFALPLMALPIGLILAGTRSSFGTIFQSIAGLFDRINFVIGTFACWAALAMVLVQFAVVLMRYVFGLSFAPLQDTIIYLHAFLFLAAGGYTLLKDGHVRVDILSRDAGPRTKAFIDFAGVYLFLLPAMALLFYVSWPYVGQAWSTMEGSTEVTGLPVYPMKTLLLLFPALLLIQGWSLAVRSLMTFWHGSEEALS
jgi:TRAP-type mannitol/chloroaromatic compound transport system permease small subunit